MGEDLIADGEPSLGGSDRLDYPGGLHAQSHRRLRAYVPGAQPDEVIPVPDSSRSNLDQHLVTHRARWIRKVEPLYPSAKGTDPGRTHPGIVAQNAALHDPDTPLGY
jgi:hypothetical protein